MSTEHYAKIINLLPEATLILSGDGRIILVNPAATRLLASPEGRIENSLLQTLSVSRGDAINSYLRQCSRSRQITVGCLAIKMTDRVQVLVAKGAMIEPRLENREAVILLRLFPKAETNFRFQALKEQIEDLNSQIVKRLRAEYELRTQGRWLEVTLSSIGDAVITTDSRSHITFMNPVAEVMTEWNQNDAVGKPLSEVFVVINEYTGDPVENPAEKALREGAIVALANHSVLVSKNGARISIEDTAAPIALDDKIEGAILVFHDVSDRRQLEKQLMERAERLELANRRKNEFLTMLAHELRSPLAPIGNAIEIMRLLPDKPASLDQPQAVICRQVQHLKRLIDDMLDVSRITRGKMNMVRQKVDFAALVRLVCSDFQAQFYQSRIYLNTTIPSSEVWIDADTHRITQVLHNLLINAIKFTPPGGSTTVSLSVEGNYSVLRVVDTGIGIDESVMPDLFEPFIQAAQSLDRNIGGLGLGLSLVKGIVELHNGRVNATSGGLHKGTTIAVELPLAEMKTPVETPDILKTSKGKIENHRILLIEDEPDAATTMSQLLELLGHQVYVARTGPEGLKKAAAVDPGIIFCDIGLPGLDGFAVAERLRQSETTSAITLVALTGYGDSEFIERAKKAGFDHHITKPANIDDIQLALVAKRLVNSK